jgi:hypothetical protein
LPSDSIQLGLLQARSIYPPALSIGVELLPWSLWRQGRQFMVITRKQIKAANKRGSAAIARGPVARAEAAFHGYSVAGKSPVA